jgi:hypothetical protein
MSGRGFGPPHGVSADGDVESDRVFGLLSLIVNATAAAIPMVWLIAR